MSGGLSGRFEHVDRESSDLPIEISPDFLDEPRTDDELHEYVKRRTGKSIPRRAVCPHHRAPFEFFADVYFGRTRSTLALAPRGGAKSWKLGLLAYLRCKFASKLKALVVGSIEQQSQEVYGHVKEFIADDPESDVDSTLKTKTVFPNRAELRTVTGSESSVRGPRPNLALLDEVDDFNPRVLQTALLMASDSNGIESQNVLASTKQHPHGIMQGLEDEIRRAVAAGEDPPYDFYSWCLLDCMAPVANCADGCGCERVKKGRNEDGSDRTFAQICAGKLRNADGWITLAEAWRKFRTTDAQTFEAEMLCGRASTRGLIMPTFSRDSHAIRGFQPHAYIGPTYSSVDFGDSNPTALVYITFVTNADGVKVKDWSGKERVIPYGSYVVHGEIYKARLSAASYTAIVKKRDAALVNRLGEFTVRERYYDAQAAAARREWSECGITLVNFARKDVRFQVRKTRELVEDDRLYVDASCPNLLSEMESWRYDTKPNADGAPYKGTDTQDHAIDALRYGIANMLVRLQEAKTYGKPENVVQLRPQTGASESPWQIDLGARL